MSHRLRRPAIALAALVLLTLVAAPRFAYSQGDQATVTISGPTSIADAAGTVQVNVDVANATDLAGFQFILTVDSNLLRPVSAEHTDFLAKGGREIVCASPTVDASSVLLRCVTLRLDPPGVDGKGTIAVVTLQASAKGTSSIALSHVKLVHPDGSDLPSRTVDGQLTVGRSAGGGGWFTWARAAVLAGTAVVVVLAAAFLWRRRSRRAMSGSAADLGEDVI